MFWHLAVICLFATVSAFEETHTLDPAIPTVAPEAHQNPDTCVGHCAFSLVESISVQLGSEKAVSLLQLNYNDFLAAFSNTTFFNNFCDIYHNFQHCSSKCQPGYLHQMLMRSSEIIDHYCVYNREAIQKKFPCLGTVKPQPECVKQCTKHHDAVTSLMGNFRHLALNGDTTTAEKYLEESCEYVICTLHCDVPSIAHHCDFETANLVITLTRKSFESMETLALDMGAVHKWPKMCADIKTYRLPQPASPPTHDDPVIAQASASSSSPADVSVNRVETAAVVANGVDLVKGLLPALAAIAALAF